MKTVLKAVGEKFLINDKLVYSEFPKKEAHGLLMNARFIQGIFDDKSGRERYNRFGREFDPDTQTNELIEHLPEWYAHGLRAITVGLQGGGPCFTIKNETIFNNPFSEDGTSVDPEYLERLKRIIKACDEIGMVVIVSYFYHVQAARIIDDDSIMRAVRTVSNWLRDEKFTNVIIEIANEHDCGAFKSHSIVYTQKGVVQLIDIAKRESGGMLVGCSPLGGVYDEEIIKASTVILIHGNGMSRNKFYNLIQRCKLANPNTPIVCNEDSQAFTEIDVAIKTGTSWGYYNNDTKQEPPTDWSITKGEDFFFAKRLAQSVGIEIEEIPFEEQFYLQGFEEHKVFEDQRWIRLASFCPEKIYYVDFYCDGELYYTAYDEPFMVNYICNWKQNPITGDLLNKDWEARIHLTDGSVIIKKK